MLRSFADDIVGELLDLRFYEVAGVGERSGISCVGVSLGFNKHTIVLSFAESKDASVLLFGFPRFAFSVSKVRLCRSFW